MQEKNKLVEEAFIQMKQVEEAIAENAKGILASTMKEEINQLVKESLSEQTDDEVEADADVDLVDTDVDTEVDTDVDTDEIDADNDDDEDIDLDIDIDSEETPIDLTNASDEEILKVFKAMGEEDGIIVKKDGDNVHLTDNDADVEYLVKLGESKSNTKTLKEMRDETEDQSVDDVINAIFTNETRDEDDEAMDMDEMWGGDKGDFKRRDGHKIGDVDGHYKDFEMDETRDEDDEALNMDEDIVYEIEFDESHDEDNEEYQMDETRDEDNEEYQMDETRDEDNESLEEAYDHKKSKKSETKEGKNMTVKPKGTGIGHGPKFKYKDKAAGGFKEDKKEGPKTMGTGKAKFEYKKGANMEGKSKVVKKAETKEAARTLGMGSDFREGGLPKQRAHSKFNLAIKQESVEAELNMLREKNEEYRKALNVFREKLNEVAIFNSNLAYATRLFTEHSTTKKEKINILRRFDDVETLKESKNLYKSLKDELGGRETKSINESVAPKLDKTVSTGSSTSLIESKTYENPQFLRMRDLMSKLG